MFGDVPDPTVMTIRVGFRTVSDAHTRVSKHCSRRGFGAWRLIAYYAESFGLREEKRERERLGDCFRRPKMSGIGPTILSL